MEIKRRRILQVDLVKQANLASEARLSRILNGRVEATEAELKSIYEALGIDKYSIFEMGAGDE